MHDLEYMIPESMKLYLSHNGRHFSKNACEYAVSLMRRSDGARIQMIDRNELKSRLASYNITIDNAELYDCVYVYCMCMADFYSSSITDEHHVLMYVKDLIDDPDNVDGFVFNRWYADMCLKGKPIDWETIL